MKYTETKEFRLAVVETLLLKAQNDLEFLESETGGEVEVSPVQDTVANAILLIRECQ